MKQGFTLIELLLVISIIAILAVLVFVALNPVKRFQDARQAKRVTDVETILTAIHLYTNDFTGTLPTGLSKGMSEAQLGTATSGCTTSAAGCSVTTASCLDLSSVLASYLKTIPIDPKGSASQTGYSVVVDASGIVTVKACLSESGNISTSR